MILGIEKKQISHLFILENLVLGLAAFIISLLIGIVFGNVFSAIIMRLFEMPYQISLKITIEPILLSVLYFILIYAFSLLRTSFKIKKMKIHDLLYLEKRNEQKIWKKKKYRNILFVVFVMMGIVGLYLCDYFFQNTDRPEMLLWFCVSVILLIISIYGITFTLGDFLLTFVCKRKNLKC